MANFPWFRFYSETPNDKKLDLIAEESGMQFLTVLGAWTLLLCLASDSPVRGTLQVTSKKRYSNGYISKQLRLSLSDTENLLNLFKEYDMIDFDENEAIIIKNWDKRQFKSDSSMDRVRKSRENKKSGGGNNDVTLQDSYSNATETVNVTLPSVSASVSDSDSFSLKDSLTNFSDQNVYRIYEANIGALTPIIANRLDMDVEDYSFEWVEKAIELAVTNEARNLAYIEAILARWKKDGFGVDKRQQKQTKRVQIDPYGNRVEL